MAISEERLQLLLPKRLKAEAQRQAELLGISIGQYVRQLIESDLQKTRESQPASRFPFGERPIHTGRTHGSVEHDRPD